MLKKTEESDYCMTLRLIPSAKQATSRIKSVKSLFSTASRTAIKPILLKTGVTP